MHSGYRALSCIHRLDIVDDDDPKGSRMLFLIALLRRRLQCVSRCCAAARLGSASIARSCFTALLAGVIGILLSLLYAPSVSKDIEDSDEPSYPLVWIEARYPSSMPGIQSLLLTRFALALTVRERLSRRLGN